jgi:putative phosphoesterase
MIVGILSDTHGYFHPSLPFYFESVDLIIHAGDVGSEDILLGLEALAPVRAVFGNVDGWELRKSLPEHDRFELEGVSIWTTHIAGRPGRWQLGMGTRLQAAPPDIFICGHSHILQIERVGDLNNMLFINPGASGRQGLHAVKTCVRLEILNGKASKAEVIHLDE